jgi:hypothetical protein
LIGKVRLDPAKRTVSFPAQFNMNEGVIEYLLVSNAGKTHESLFKTEAEPFHIQTAMLLLGAKGEGAKDATNAIPTGPINADQLRAASARPLVGENVKVEVAWTLAGAAKQVAIEDFVQNVKAKAPMTRGPFVFTGSRIFQGVFLAQQEGSIISVITDPVAVFNNPRPGRDDEDNWKIIPDSLPPLDSPAQITITLPPPAAPATPGAK